MTIPADHKVPSRRDALVFGARAVLLRGRRAVVEIGRRPARHPRADGLRDAAVVAGIRSPLWSGPGGEHDLTAGKIHNLRLAVRALDGVEVPAGAVFSFWRQIGRASRRRGFVAGRELREGCLVASTGGGLCQLSNGLYEAALAAGFEIVERHAHSRLVPGSRAAAGRDATVFWNYVDLRFRSRASFRIEARLTATELEIRFRSAAAPAAGIVVPFPVPRESAHDCVGCAREDCRRRLPRGAEITRRPAAWLVDGSWPEFAALMRAQAGPQDRLFLPMRRRTRYAWPELAGGESRATLVALARARALRRLPVVGGALPRAMLGFDRRLAEAYARRLSHRHTHLVVGQGLLPHLWRLGCLQGRSFDVLMERWPLAALQARLDRALVRRPESPTLGDFRAPDDIVMAEAGALAAATRLYTPHGGIAARFADRAVHLDWVLPDVAAAPRPAIGGRTILFPASPLARKGAYALREAVEGLDIDLAVTGRAREDDKPFWRNVAARVLPAGPWPDPIAAVVLPAIVEHQPRALLRAMALGIPVIATAACGLDEGPGVTLVPEDDAAALREALLQALGDAPQRLQASARNSA
ncbi:VanW family protein [Inquilinus sp. NPDC058860]|uniref:VanW family protein n=1 Tax=Inquilinus sp. NPDC058860 TaxID=3346652 RepID=UPI0036C4A4F1